MDAVPSSTTIPDGDDVLWDVVAQHLDEAEFHIERFERALESSIFTTGHLATVFEPRLLAHLDGLVVNGAQVPEKLLLPRLVSAVEEEDLFALIAVVLALLGSRRYEVVQQLLLHENSIVGEAARRAAVLADDPGLDAWAVQQLSSLPSGERAVALVSYAAERGLAVPDALFEGGDVRSDSLLSVLAKAASGNPARHLAFLESLLESANFAVVHAALPSALMAGSWPAWRRLVNEALKPKASANPMALLAALGDPRDHEGLVAKLADPAERSSALFALSFSGNLQLIPTLLEHCRSQDPLDRRLAAQAVASIIGLDLTSESFLPSEGPRDAVKVQQRKDDEARAALPPFEEDDLDAALAPPPEAALPELDPDAIERTCRSRIPQMNVRMRHVGGRPWSCAAVATYLLEAPLRMRPLHAESLAIRSGGEIRVDASSFSHVQRRRLQRLLATPARQDSNPIVRW